MEGVTLTLLSLSRYLFVRRTRIKRGVGMSAASFLKNRLPLKSIERHPGGRRGKKAAKLVFPSAPFVSQSPLQEHFEQNTTSNRPKDKASRCETTKNEHDVPPPVSGHKHAPRGTPKRSKVRTRAGLNRTGLRNETNRKPRRLSDVGEPQRGGGGGDKQQPNDST